MTQSDIDELISIIKCLTSSKSSDQSRQEAERFIMSSISEDLIRIFIELIKSDQIQSQDRDSSIIIFSNILKNTKLIENIANICQILFEIYSLSIQLIFDSTSISSSHYPAILLIVSINSVMTLSKQLDNKIELSFYQDIFKSLNDSTTFPAIHGFSFAISDLLNDFSIIDYCKEEEFLSFLNTVNGILQKNCELHENEQKSSETEKEEDQIQKSCFDILNLSKNIFDQDEICSFFKGNQQIFQEFNQSIINFLNFKDTFSYSMNCFASLAESDQTLLFSFLPQLIEVMTSFINESTIDYSNKITYDSIISICNLIYYLSKKKYFLYLDIDFSPLILLITKIISIVPQNCDSDCDWEPHIICQYALDCIVSNISQIMLNLDFPEAIKAEDQESIKQKFVAVISDLFSFAENLLSSKDYNERSSSLAVLQILIKHVDDSIFLKFKENIFQLVNDEIPRVREASIFCLLTYVTSFPDHRCTNDDQFSTITEIYEISKKHINEFSIQENDLNDCISISNTTFYLLYYISLIPGFEQLPELIGMIFFNLPFLLSNHRNIILGKILKMIRNAHFCIIESYTIIEQLLLFILSKSDPSEQELFSFLNCSSCEDLIPSIIDIIFEYYLRFEKKINISDDLIHNLIDMFLSFQSNRPTYPLPLIGFVLSKNLVDTQNYNEFVQPLCQLSFALLQKNNEVYAHQDIKVFYHFSIHSILFFKYMIIGKILPKELTEMIFDLILPLSYGFISKESMEIGEEEEKEDEEIRVPFDVQVYSVNLALLIAKRIPEFMTCEGESLLKNSTSILNSYSYFRVGEIKRANLYKIALETVKIILSVFPAPFLEENCQMLINNLVGLIIVLKKQTKSNQDTVIKLLNYIANYFPVIVKKAIVHQKEDYITFLQYFTANKDMMDNIIKVNKIVQSKI